MSSQATLDRQAVVARLQRQLKMKNGCYIDVYAAQVLHISIDGDVYYFFRANEPASFWWDQAKRCAGNTRRQWTQEEYERTLAQQPKGRGGGQRSASFLKHSFGPDNLA